MVYPGAVCLDSSIFLLRGFSHCASQGARNHSEELQQRQNRTVTPAIVTSFLCIRGKCVATIAVS